MPLAWSVERPTLKSLNLPCIKKPYMIRVAKILLEVAVHCREGKRAALEREKSYRGEHARGLQKFIGVFSSSYTA